MSKQFNAHAWQKNANGLTDKDWVVGLVIRDPLGATIKQAKALFGGRPATHMPSDNTIKQWMSLSRGIPEGVRELARADKRFAAFFGPDGAYIENDSAAIRLSERARAAWAAIRGKNKNGAVDTAHSAKGKIVRTRKYFDANQAHTDAGHIIRYDRTENNGIGVLETIIQLLEDASTSKPRGTTKDAILDVLADRFPKHDRDTMRRASVNQMVKDIRERRNREVKNDEGKRFWLEPAKLVKRAAPRLGSQDRNRINKPRKLSKTSEHESDIVVDGVEEDTSNFDEGSREDERLRAQRETVLRPGQQAFRKALLRHYRGRCVITGSNVKWALEAAHIRPHLGQKSDKLANGLLLRTCLQIHFARASRRAMSEIMER